MSKDVLTGTYVSMKTLKTDNTIRIEVELDCTIAEAAPFLEQGAVFAIARIKPDASQKNQVNESVKGGPLSKNAAMLCRDEKFQEWAGEQTEFGNWGTYLRDETGARYLILNHCEIESRAELDHDKDAAERYEQLKKSYYDDVGF